MTELNRIDWMALPLREAYKFGSERGLEKEIGSIQDMEIEWDSYTSSVRRGFVVDLFKQKAILEEFIKECWPNGMTPAGENRIRRYLRIKSQYEKYLASGETPSRDEEEPDVESGQQFVFETHLRDFLAEHLNVLEPGLTRYQDTSSNGKEYPVAGGRIDILAIDRNQRFVVIELKVSRGRNPTIGQLLYYMGWVDTNLAKEQKSRGIIVAKEISDDLRLACQRVSDVALYKYDLSVTTTKVYP